MPMIHTFGVIGGDERMRYLADSIAADGYPVFAAGLEKLRPCRKAVPASLEELAKRSSVIVLPLPASRDGKTINAPYSEQEIAADDALVRLLRNKIVYGGMIGKLVSTSEVWQEIGPEDYYRREALAVANAIPTAEGAIGVAVREYPGTVNGAKCLVTGFGRIGKNLAMLLKGMGADVSAAARKQEDRMLMRAMGVRPLSFREITQRYDLIFNTVPAQVIGPPVLNRQDTETWVIELASAPGGVDRMCAERCGVHVVDAPSLPGLVAPKTAAEYIKETIYAMLEE